MLRKRFVIPVAVGAAATAALAAGIMRADAAESPPVGGSCAVTYAVSSQWGSGFTGSVEIRNTGATAVDGWELGFTFPAGQGLDGGWNGTWTQSGSAVRVKDAGWNRTIASGSAVSLGFNGTGAAGSPGSFTLNGAVCDGAVSAVPPSPGPSPSVSPSRGAGTCEANAAIPAGKYWLNNNLWGKDTGSGEQCSSDAGLDGDTLAWRTEWEWTGQPSSVKSYASAVLGWHWGWKAGDTGLPVRLSDHEPVRANWDFTVTEDKPGAMNVAYDLWVHDIANPDWQNQPTDEVMVWLYRSGGAGPVGTRQATVTVGGTSWDLYRGDIGWNVYSFVRTGNTSSADLDLTDFTDELTARAWLPATRYLSSVQAGTEVFTGAGALETDAYSVRIG
ncbi:cellulose binding domain-containing protein [Actinoplanes sp. NPDC051494]|uniref:GH12 family glycosyl hydrolase domain-containing protein n=1 Tax=Actinoplanes sp. NPDC051494 TaxID=3363907 RepID=UPI00379C26C6